MIRHLVLFKFKGGITWDDERAPRAEAATAGHPKHIPEILAWECGRNMTPRPVAYDFALVGTFRDREALQRYMVDPDHMIGVNLWKEISTWVVVDYDVADADFPHPGFVRAGVLGGNAG